ncbi:MAG: chemotaxis protein CheW [Myxococcota bacterium]
MTARELSQLIFHPGFSTAKAVTNVSGRGVGMDVVRNNIEKIGGTIDIQSIQGQGTTLKLKIPLTLAIIPALIVTCGGDRYAIPQVNLLELVRLEGREALTRIERIYNTPVYRLRGRLLPLVYLSKALRLEHQAKRDDEPDEPVANIVVLQADGQQFGLVVDAIDDTEEIVVKPLCKQLKGIPCYAGATIMGDGRVALILDGLGLAQSAGLITENQGLSLSEALREHGQVGDDHQSLLLFQIGVTGRMAVPLAEVARLEEFPHEAIELSGTRQVVQYRGEIMPLIDLGGMFMNSGPVSKALPLQVVVYTTNNRSMGLVVDRIIDIVDENITTQSRSSRQGIIASAVIQGRVTEILDVEGAIRMVEPDFFVPMAS